VTPSCDCNVDFLSYVGVCYRELGRINEAEHQFKLGETEMLMMQWLIYTCIDRLIDGWIDGYMNRWMNERWIYHNIIIILLSIHWITNLSFEFEIFLKPSIFLKPFL
jgi:hypothetical protein